MWSEPIDLRSNARGEERKGLFPLESLWRAGASFRKPTSTLADSGFHGSLLGTTFVGDGHCWPRRRAPRRPGRQTSQTTNFPTSVPPLAGSRISDTRQPWLRERHSRNITHSGVSTPRQALFSSFLSPF